MAEDKIKTESSPEESKDTEKERDLCCCYVVDPCGCYYDPCCIPATCCC